MADDLLTTQEAAALLGVGTTSIKRWADSGLLHCVKTPGGHRRFPRQAVEALLGQSLPEPLTRSSPSSDWLASLIGGITAAEVAEALKAERHELGSWTAVAENMGAVLDEIGRAWARGDITVIEEHIASERLARGIATCCETIQVPAGAPRCFVMSAEHDDHTLGLNLLELCLRENGWAATWSGRRTPVHFACEFILSTDVQMVAVSASQHSRDPALLSDQSVRLGQACQRRGIPLVLGGTGLWPERLAYGHRLKRFSEIVDLLKTALRTPSMTD